MASSWNCQAQREILGRQQIVASRYTSIKGGMIELYPRQGYVMTGSIGHGC